MSVGAGAMVSKLVHPQCTPDFSEGEFSSFLGRQITEEAV